MRFLPNPQKFVLIGSIKKWVVVKVLTLDLAQLPEMVPMLICYHPSPQRVSYNIKMYEN